MGLAILFGMSNPSNPTAVVTASVRREGVWKDIVMCVESDRVLDHARKMSTRKGCKRVTIRVGSETWVADYR